MEVSSTYLAWEHKSKFWGVGPGCGYDTDVWWFFFFWLKAVCSSELPVISWSLGCSTIRHLCFWLLDETTCSTPCYWAGTSKKVLALSLIWSRKLTHSVALASFVSSYHLSVRLVWKGWLLSWWCHWSILLSVCHFGEQIKCSPRENCPIPPSLRDWGVWIWYWCLMVLFLLAESCVFIWVTCDIMVARMFNHQAFVFLTPGWNHLLDPMLLSRHK